MHQKNQKITTEAVISKMKFSKSKFENEKKIFPKFSKSLSWLIKMIKSKWWLRCIHRKFAVLENFGKFRKKWPKNAIKIDFSKKFGLDQREVGYLTIAWNWIQVSCQNGQKVALPCLMGSQLFYLLQNFWKKLLMKIQWSNLQFFSMRLKSAIYSYSPKITKGYCFL